jgi:hypothetical protein
VNLISGACFPIVPAALKIGQMFLIILKLFSWKHVDVIFSMVFSGDVKKFHVPHLYITLAIPRNKDYTIFFFLE